jgi:D-glycero-D-manno-heptose 1,7-bisphosphate phosphatase
MRAVFLDRDGCLNEDWFNPATGAWESPISPEDLVLRPGVPAALRRLQANGWALFLVSNQPSFAKGKCRLEDLRAVHARFAALMDEAGIVFADYYYSHHHPDGVVPGYSGPSPDRKPNPYFLHRAAERHGVDLAASWVVGDRDTDVEFGRRGGVRTIQVANPHAGAYAGWEQPDHRADDILAAAEIIIHSNVRDPHALAQ